MPPKPRRQPSPDLPGLSLSAGRDELSIAANANEVRRASEWLEARCQEHRVPPAMTERLLLSLNEVIANVLAHGGSTALAAPIGLVLEVEADERAGNAGLTVSDAGVEFDPLSVPTRALPKTLDEASVGGLGLVMIRRCSDWIRYRREDGRNHFTFGTRWALE